VRDDRRSPVLTDLGMITSAPDPGHNQRIRLSLTDPAIQLVPVLAHLGAWGRRHLPVTRELAIRAELLERGGPPLWDEFMDELRELHLGIPRPAGSESVLARLTEAYRAEVAA
jgi:hypothetical protein